MAFLGMRGSGDWSAEERPTNYRQGLLYLYPNGMMPLTGMLSKMAEEKVDDPQYTWWTKALAKQRGDLTGVFTNASLTTPYVSGGTPATTLFVRLSEAQASEFKVTHQVLLRKSDNLDLDTNAKVTAVVINGASSYLACKLLEVDDNGGAVKLASANAVLAIGNINSEGGPMPDAVAYDPQKFSNYIQTLRTSLSITRIARRTRLRTEDAYKEAKRESLELHGIEMEKMFFWGIPTENVGANGKLERTSGGLFYFIRSFAPENVFNYATDPAFAGRTWLSGGEEWLDASLEKVSRFGNADKMAFSGSGAVLGINRLAKSSGQVFLKSMDTSYGLKVTEWVTPMLTINMRTHPLFSYEPTTRNTMVIVEPKELRYRFIDDTNFVEDDGKHGASRLDGTNEEWMTDCGLELHFPLKFAILSGINQDNLLVA